MLDNFLSFYFARIILIVTFAPFCSDKPLRLGRMKRESGESPEQSRCCKLQFFWDVCLSMKATVPYIYNKVWEGQANDGVSQKTCKTESKIPVLRGKVLGIEIV